MSIKLARSECSCRRSIKCLLRDTTSNFTLDPVIFFFCQLIALLSIFRKLKHNKGVINRTSDYSTSNNLPKEVLEGPLQSGHDKVEQEAEGWIEEESKVDCDGSADKFKLGFKATNKATRACRIK